eukprot:1158697-Pelagomonas_calceolata.AAC.11
MHTSPEPAFLTSFKMAIARTKPAMGPLVLMAGLDRSFWESCDLRRLCVDGKACTGMCDQNVSHATGVSCVWMERPAQACVIKLGVMRLASAVCGWKGLHRHV